MNIEYYAGVLCGILCVLLLFYLYKYLIKKRENKIYSDEYDERQILARGKAYKYGFYAMMIGMVVNSWIVDNVYEWCTFTVFVFTNILIGIFVFVFVCIFNDAYLRLSEKPCLTIVSFFIIGAVNLIGPISEYMKNRTLTNEDGKFYSINLECAVLMFMVVIILIIKMVVSKKEDGDIHEES